MDIDVDEVAELRCPLCDNPLARGDHRKAMRKLETKAKTKADMQAKTMIKKHEREISEIEQRHKAAIANSKSLHEDSINLVRKDMNAMLDDQRQTIKTEYARQLKDMQKSHKQLEIQTQREAQANDRALKSKIAKLEREKKASLSAIKQTLEKQYERNLKDLDKRRKHDLAHTNKMHHAEIEQHKLRLRDLEKRNKETRSVAEASVRADLNTKLESKNQQIQEQTVQLERARTRIEDLSKQLNQRQSELVGEAGEQNLLHLLKQAFPTDQFITQKRGNSSSDLVHRIREGNLMPDTQIVYDNKSSTTITKRDIDKARKYRDIHNTEYSLIVSSSIPSRYANNKLLCTINGVMLVHTSIIREVATTLRSGIIAIHKASESQQVRSTKEAMLYEYVAGREFSDIVALLQTSRSELESLQTKEEKQHTQVWALRKNLVDSLRKTEIEITGKIYGIVQGEIDLESSITR